MLAQAREPLGERRRLALDPFPREPRQASERSHDEAQRAIAVHGEHPDHRAERDGGGARQDRGGGEPALVRQPWRRAEEDDQHREDVVGALDDDRADDLRRRRAGPLGQRDDPCGLAGPRRHDVVEEVADHRRGEHGPARRPAGVGEQRAPAHRPQNRLRGERRHRRDQPPGVAALQRAPGAVPVDAPHGEVGEDGRERRRRSERERALSRAPAGGPRSGLPGQRPDHRGVLSCGAAHAASVPNAGNSRAPGC